MLKQGFYTLALTSLLTVPALAANDTSPHPAHDMDTSVPPKASEIEQQADYQWQKDNQAAPSADGNHPAKKMGESPQKQMKKNKEDYDEKRLESEAVGNVPHPAHRSDN